MRPRDRGRGPPENRRSRPADTGPALEKPHTDSGTKTTKTARQEDQVRRCSPVLPNRLLVPKAVLDRMLGVWVEAG